MMLHLLMDLNAARDVEGHRWCLALQQLCGSGTMSTL